MAVRKMTLRKTLRKSPKKITVAQLKSKIVRQHIPHTKPLSTYKREGLMRVVARHSPRRRV